MGNSHRQIAGGGDKRGGRGEWGVLYKAAAGLSWAAVAPSHAYSDDGN